jgi:SOS response regulatory protein OraA/RecX
VIFLAENGLLDDKRYLRLAVEKLDRALVGPRKIRETLTKHIFPPRYVEVALARKIDYTRRAFKLLGTRAGAAEHVRTAPGKKKLTDYLVRQGYDYSTAASAVNRFSDSLGESD